MLRGIFDKRQVKTAGERPGRTPAAASTGARVDDHQVDPRPPVRVDDSLVALSRELSGLSEMSVSSAARERGWASLQRELERRPVRASGSRAGVSGAPVAGGAGARGTARTARYHNRRWALGSIAAAIVVLALIGTYSAGVLQTGGNGDDPGTVASVSGSDSTVTSDATGTSTVSTGASTTTDGTQPDTTQTTGTDVTGTTGSTSSGTGTTDNGATSTTDGGGSSTTTKPSSPTTTSDQQMAAAQREGSAKAAAIYLTDLVITGNTSGARSLIAAEAQGLLAQMVMSLEEPHGYTDVKATTINSNTVRVTLGINDRVVDGSGEVREIIKRFVIQVKVDDDSAVITGIYAGS